MNGPTKDPLLAAVERMNRLLALVVTKGEATTPAIAMLYRSGHSYGEIGALLGMKKDAVRMRLSGQKKGSKSPKAAKAVTTDDQ
jgi:hypothetical protein